MLYADKKGKALAEAIARATCGSVVKRPDLYVLKHSVSPAVIIELGFMDNLNDLDNIRTREKELAKLILNGVSVYDRKR